MKRYNNSRKTSGPKPCNGVPPDEAARIEERGASPGFERNERIIEPEGKKLESPQSEDMPEMLPSTVESELETGIESRQSRRDSTHLQAVVEVSETADESWEERAQVVTISRSGAGFTLARPCALGRLVTLILPLPRELRAYDHDELLYAVLGLVQHCNESVTDGVSNYHIGVAFIGKNIPISYEENPQQNYRITGMNELGLWMIVENEGQFKSRLYPRHAVAIEFAITLLDAETRTVSKEQCITNEVSAAGASVMSSLNAAVGDKIKIVCNEYDFFTMAVVRGRGQVSVNGLTSLHMEFVSARFPVGRLPPSRLLETETRKSEDVRVPSDVHAFELTQLG